MPRRAGHYVGTRRWRANFEPPKKLYIFLPHGRAVGLNLRGGWHLTNSKERVYFYFFSASSFR